MRNFFTSIKHGLEVKKDSNRDLVSTFLFIVVVGILTHMLSRDIGTGFCMVACGEGCCGGLPLTICK